jgi:hypothetical protein
VWQDRGPPAFRVGQMAVHSPTPANPLAGNLLLVKLLDHSATLETAPGEVTSPQRWISRPGGTGGGRFLNTTGPLAFRVRASLTVLWASGLRRGTRRDSIPKIRVEPRVVAGFSLRDVGAAVTVEAEDGGGDREGSTGRSCGP